MERHVLMKLRLAIREDFTDQFNKMRIGALYFSQSASGGIERHPHYLSEGTDLQSFKELYANDQIYVPVGLFDEVAVLEEEN